MKVLLVIIGVIIVATSISLSVHYHKKSFSAVNDLNEERFLRMVAQEDLDKAKTRVSFLESKISQAKKKVASIRKLADQTELINKDLKMKLKSSLSVKTSLELQVKDLMAKLSAKALGNVSIEGL